jgi:hypothetical protein
MNIPELPYGMRICTIQRLTNLDVLQLICNQLTDDLGTLYRLSFCSRFISSIALSTLYSSLVKFPSDYDDEDRIGEDATSHTLRLTKWSSLWKSIAVSAINSRSTASNYAAALRVLNLRDLLSLMEEFRTPRVQNVREEFFSGGLEVCNKTRSFTFGNTPRTIFDANLSSDSLADLMAPGLRNVTTLIRQTTERPSSGGPGHLYLWLTHLAALESLQIFEAEVFEDKRTRDVVKNCPNLKSLELYMWTLGSGTIIDPDIALSQLLSTIQGHGLERFVVKHGHECFRQASLDALCRYHGSTLTEFEVSDISESCLGSFGMVPSITNLRSCTLQFDNRRYAFGPNMGETFESVSQFLIQNKNLERLDLNLFGIEHIIPSALPSLRLKYLSIAYVNDIVLPKACWTAIATQSNTLESFVLRNNNRAHEFLYSADEMMNAIRLLYKLKFLGITTFSVIITDLDIGNIALNCRDLEELSCSSPSLGDASLRALSTLPRLTTFSSL